MESKRRIVERKVVKEFLAFAFLCFPVLSFAFPCSLWSKSAGVTAAPVLTIPLGARAAGMGGAFTAVADDLYAIHFNPAGLSLLDQKEFSGMFLKEFEDTSLGFLGYAHPMGFPGLSGQGGATLAFGSVFLDTGKIEINRTYPDGTFRDRRTLRAGSDMVLNLAYAEKISEGNFSDFLDIGDQSLGLGVKWVRSTLAEEYTASAFALDAGYLAQSSERNWRLGVSLANLGNKLKFIEQGDPLPLLLRLGGACRIFQEEFHQVWMAADANLLVREEDIKARIGGEYRFQDILSLRIGYQFLEDVAGMTAGFGIRRGQLSFDYAWMLFTELQDAHRVSVTYRFGGRPAKVSVPRRRKVLLHEEEPLPGIDAFPEPNTKPQEDREPEYKDIQPTIPGWE